MNNQKRDELLIEMHADVREMKTKLDNDYTALHGPNGMIEKHDKLDSRVQILENHRNLLAWLLGVIITGGGIILAYFKK